MLHLAVFQAIRGEELMGCDVMPNEECTQKLMRRWGAEGVSNVRLLF